MEASDLTHDVLKYDLGRLMPIRCVIQTSEDGVITGLTEESFSMGWETNRVNIFWSSKAYSILGEHVIDGVKGAEENAERLGGEVIDPLSPDSPIVIDWQKWRAATNKYDKRNAHFVIK